MIIKILTNDNKPICAYCQGRWVGNTSPLVISEAIEILLIMLKSSRSEKLFHKAIENWPETSPGSQQNEFPPKDVRRFIDGN